MNYFEFDGHIELLEPFSLDIPNHFTLPRNSSNEPLIPATTLKEWFRLASYSSLAHMMKDKGQLLAADNHNIVDKEPFTGELFDKEYIRENGLQNDNVREVNPLTDLYGDYGLEGSLGVSSAVGPQNAVFNNVLSIDGDVCIEALDAGTSLRHSMRLSGSYGQSFQFLLWTISKMPLFRLGGLKAQNFGRVGAKWTIIRHSFDAPMGEPVGLIGFRNNEFIFDLNEQYKFSLKDFEGSLMDQGKFNFLLSGQNP